jgi:hypothetical protein
MAAIGSLLHRLGDDVKTIARGEAALVTSEIQQHAKLVATDIVASLLAGVVALIGLGMLCVVVVVALAPLIPPLWLRLLIMAVVYLGAGGAVAAAFGKRVRRHASVNFEPAKLEAKATVDNIKAGLEH